MRTGICCHLVDSAEPIHTPYCLVLSFGSQVVSTKQLKLGKMQEFVVLLVCMQWVGCLFVCLLFVVCFKSNLGDWVS